LKFTDGNWMTREGYNIHSPKSIHDYEKYEDSLVMYAPCKNITNRGDTINGPLLTIKLTSPQENIIRVQAWHFKGEQNKPPYFPLNKNMLKSLNVNVNNNNELECTSGDLKVTIDQNEFKMNFLNSNNRITYGDKNMLSWIEALEGSNYFRGQLNLGVSEHLYGLGERFTPFIKNGQTVDIWNKDGGTSSEQSYKNIPFYLSNKGYGIFVNHPEEVNFELGSESVSKSQFSVKGENLDFYIINGPSPKEVISRYTSLTGKPALPPAWSFGLWLSTSFTTNYDEKTVNYFIDEMAKRNIPLSVFHFDCFWMREFEWSNFHWDTKSFPNPREMLKRLKEKGLRISVWVNPYIAQKSKLFDEAAQKGFLIRKTNGDIWQWDLWQPGMGIIDFSNAEACEWFSEKLKALLDMGVDTFKTDFGERIPTDVVYFDGSDPYKMHNYYSYKYNETVFNLLKQEKGEKEAILFARSSTAGGQKFPVHWGGDCDSTYEAMAESLRGGLSLTLSGFGYWSHDIGGFENTATSDVFKRWLAFGLLSSHSRLHGSSSYRVPWNFDEESVEVARYFTRLKNKLMPYLYRAAIENNKTGLPVMRAMLLEFPKDPTCDFLDKQYMLGDSILVSPIFNENGKSLYYLPTGKWTHLLTGKVFEGGTWNEEYYDYMSLPLFVRPNSILPIGNNKETPEYDYSEDTTFNIYELEDGRKVSTTIYNLEGDSLGYLKVSRSSQTLSIDTNLKSNYSLKLIGYTTIKSVSDGTWDTSFNGVEVFPTKSNNRFTITL